MAKYSWESWCSDGMGGTWLEDVRCGTEVGSGMGTGGRRGRGDEHRMDTREWQSASLRNLERAVSGD